MAVATSLPECGFLRLEEWCRRAAKDPDLFRFADPTLDLVDDGGAHPGAPGGGRGLPEQRMFYVSRLRKRAGRTTMETLCV